MKILVNCSNIKKGGAIQVSYSFISELVNFRQHEWHIVISKNIEKVLDPQEISYTNIFFYHYTIRPNIFLSIFGKEKYLINLEKQIKPDVIFTVFGPSYWKPSAPHLVGYAKPHYIYPESPFFKSLTLYNKFLLLIKKKLHLWDFNNFSTYLVTETNSAAQRLKQLFKVKRIFVVSNTYNQIFDKPKLWDTSIDLPSFKGFTLITVSENYPHKNLKIISIVIKQLLTSYPNFRFRFVLTTERTIFSKTEIDDQFIYNQYILFLGKISIYQCPWLYKQANALFLPTLLECFSASYPEAMKMGIPILTSNLDFAKDICGDAALYFDPTKPEEIAEKIYYLATHNEVAKKLINAGNKRLPFFGNSSIRAFRYVKILEELYETNYSQFQNR